MNLSAKNKLLLNIAVVLLLLFNGMQLYGIFAQKDSAQPVPAKRLDDTAHVATQINVQNGCGVKGVGTVMTTFCRQNGFDVVEMGNYKSFDLEHSIVIDRNGKSGEPQRLAALLGIDPKNVVQQFNNDQMVTATVVIGKDFKSLLPWK
ncbi:MAG: LytR C-terminal domain-containing protein [Bacteroidota bacterium]